MICGFFSVEAGTFCVTMATEGRTSVRDKGYAGPPETTTSGHEANLKTRLYLTGSDVTGWRLCDLLLSQDH